MSSKRLEQADRRELVRLMESEGLSPRAAAARFGVSESTARRWRARWREGEADRCEEWFGSAEPLIAMPPPGAASPVVLPALPPRPPRVVRQRPPARKVMGARLRRVPARVRAYHWTRRQVGGLALTIAFIPVGWLLSALVFGGEADSPALTAAARAGAAAPQSFRATAARAERETGTTFVAHARRRTLTLYRTPGGKRIGRLRQRRFEGHRLPIVTLVQRRRPGWVRVFLPIRPNQSLAWVRTRDVRLRANVYRVRVEVSARRLTVWRGARIIARRKIGVGRSVSPTPTGRYFITDLVKNRNPEDLYGPFAFGLSAYSPVLTSFRGGDGQIGIHGTDDPSRLGSEVSAGCIRMGNDTIRALAEVLPLGTPVVIRS